MNIWYYCMNYHVNMYEHVVCVHWMDTAAAKEDSLKLQNLYDRDPLSSMLLSCFWKSHSDPFNMFQFSQTFLDFIFMKWYDRNMTGALNQPIPC